MPTGFDKRVGVVAVGGLLATGIAVNAHATDEIRTAISDGKVGIDLRYRYEYVDDDAASKAAGASTLRTRLSYTTAPLRDFTGTVEFEDITAVGVERYNSGFNGKTQYATVLDPPLTEVNRAFLQYDGVRDNTFRLGRHHLMLGNQRFVGNEGWRQNEQTFDAFSVTNRMLTATELTYAYVTHVHTPIGVALGSKSHLFHGVFTGIPIGRIDGYAHLIDLDGAASDSSSLGARFSGQQVYDEWTSLNYAVELATQDDYADAPGTTDADYLAFEIGGDTSGVTVAVGYEQLGGDGTYAFQMPLGTRHAFNGWADKFTTTPAAGLEDLYGTIGTSIGTLKMSAAYHMFSPDTGGGDYGSELDLLVMDRFARHYEVGAKLAAYDADSFGADTLKMWLWVSTAF